MTWITSCPGCHLESMGALPVSRWRSRFCHHLILPVADNHRIENFGIMIGIVDDKITKVVLAFQVVCKVFARAFGADFKELLNHWYEMLSLGEQNLREANGFLG